LRLLLPILSSVFLFSAVSGQNTELDSLERVLPAQQGKERVSTLNSISWHYRQTDANKGMELARDAFYLSGELDYTPGVAASLQSIGAIFEAKGAFDSALFYLNKSLALRIELSDSLEMASTLNGIAMVHDQLGNDEQALENYFLALRVYEKLEDKFSQAMVLVNVGIVYKKQKEYAKVLDYYQRALAFYEQEGSAYGTAVVRGNIGAVLIKLGQYNESIDFSEKALKGYKELGYERLSAYPMGNMAIAFDSLNKRSDARQYYLQALGIHRQNENLVEVAFTLKNLAANELKSGEVRQAYLHANEAKTLAANLAATDILMQAMDILTQCELARNDYQAAFVIQQQYNRLKDKAFEEEKTKAVFELEAKYQTEKKDRELEQQRLTLIERDLEIQKSRITQLALGGAVLLLIAVGLLVRARIKLSYQHKLEEEKMNKQQELLRAVISSVEGERKRFSEDLHDSFGQLISVLKMNVDSLSTQGPTATASERQKVFDRSVEVLDDMYGELKNVCFNLMPKTLIQHGLALAIQELSSRINHTGKVKCESHAFDLEERLADIQEISLYRIVQEWTNNVIKYSDAAQITIQITRDEHEITLTVEDNGRGFDAEVLKKGKGNGWKNLQSRTNLMKGTLELDTVPGRRGNMLTVNVPAILKNQEAKTGIEKADSLLLLSLF